MVGAFCLANKSWFAWTHVIDLTQVQQPQFCQVCNNWWKWQALQLWFVDLVHLGFASRPRHHSLICSRKSTRIFRNLKNTPVLAKLYFTSSCLTDSSKLGGWRKGPKLVWKACGELVLPLFNVVESQVNVFLSCCRRKIVRCECIVAKIQSMIGKVAV